MREMPGRNVVRTGHPGECPGRRGHRMVVLAVFCLLAAAGCSKSAVTAPPTPSTIIQSPVSPSPSVTVTATAKPSPSPSPRVSPRPSATTTAAAAVTPTVQISEASGSTKTVKQGQVLTLTLQQSSDGGYAWAFATQPNSAVLALQGQQTLPPASPLPAGSVGGSTRFRATFQAVGPGTTSFTLNEARGTEPPIQTYSLTVTVTP